MNSEELKSIRLSMGLTQKKFAEMLGVTRAAIARAEGNYPSRLVQCMMEKAKLEGKWGNNSENPLTACSDSDTCSATE